MVTRRLAAALGLAAALAAGLPAWAGAIDTAFLERPWPRQLERRYEIGWDEVYWRQKASKRDGIFAGARFIAPAGLETVWNLSADYAELKTMAPDVDRLRVLEQTEEREVVEFDMKVLWKEVTLRFEIERERPNAVRLRLANPAIGDYLGVCRMSPVDVPAGVPPQTSVEFITWLKPAMRIPAGLVLWVERLVMLKGVRKFLETCRRPPATDGGA